MNQLQSEKSPYLQQHKDNPVFWHGWSLATLEKAKAKNLPLFISIGYATCHWCHVMERESFTNLKVADFINKHFIPIKIDREERPDLDDYYLKSLQVQGISGGWPLNVFALTDGTPFWGGTYFPVEKKIGLPSFLEILVMINHHWEFKKKEIITQAKLIHKVILKLENKKSNTTIENNFIRENLFIEDKEFKDLHLKYFDEENGGFKFQKQNKFASFLNLLHLLKIAHHEKDQDLLAKIIFTVDKISFGGIYDHLGGGIARYSTDYEWKLPHFEKMLYDQALYILLLKDLFLITKNNFYQEKIYDVIHYLESNLKNSQGGFLSAEDADSDGKEGEFYLWDFATIKSLLDQEKYRDFYNFFQLDKKQNFSEMTLHARESLVSYAKRNKKDYPTLKKIIKTGLALLFNERKKRTPPQKDEKVILAWNALAIMAYATTGRSFNDRALVQKAEESLAFIYKNFKRDNQGAFYRRHIAGEGKHWAYLEDYALLGLAEQEVYESTFNLSYLKNSLSRIDFILQHFYQDGRFYRNQKEQKDIVTLGQDNYDGVEPSGVSALALLLLKGFYYTQNSKLEKLALAIFNQLYEQLKTTNLPFMISVLHDYKRGFKTVTILEKKILKNKSLISLLQDNYLPEKITLLDFSKYSKNKNISLTVCKKDHCLFPTNDLEKIEGYLFS